MSTEKLISFTIPCYNSSGYMDHCIQSIIDGSKGHLERIEVIIVDDGSTEDDTAAKADGWEAAYPGVIRAIHQENAGHGGAVNRGLENATGTYFKVVDSDDWLDEQSLGAMIELMEAFDASSEEPIDLYLCNYVSEHVERGQQVTDYKSALPCGRPFGWSEIGRFSISRYILMHSAIYRTQVLRDCGLKLPEHTFYVDNIFVYTPLPYAKRIMYMDLDLYRWFLGREDQSVNEDVMIGRVDQQIRVTKAMIDAYDLTDERIDPKLAKYMGSYLTMMFSICIIFSLLSDREDKRELCEDIKTYLVTNNPNTYDKLKNVPFIWIGMHEGAMWERLDLGLYKLAKRLFEFN